MNKQINSDKGLELQITGKDIGETNKMAKKKHFYRRNGLAIPISCSFSSFFFLSEQDSSLRLSDHSHPGDSEMHE